MKKLIPPENITCVNLLLNIIQTRVIAVGNNSLTLFLECIQVVDYAATKESTTIFKSGFVDNYLCSFCLNAFHDALN